MNHELWKRTTLMYRLNKSRNKSPQNERACVTWSSTITKKFLNLETSTKRRKLRLALSFKEPEKRRIGRKRKISKTFSGDSSLEPVAYAINTMPVKQLEEEYYSLEGQYI